jgi:hypothetical protein
MPASTRSLEGVEQSLAMLSKFRSPLLNTRKKKWQVDSESAIVKYLVEHFRNTKELYLHADTADIAAQLLESHVGSDPVRRRPLIRRIYAEILKWNGVEYL